VGGCGKAQYVAAPRGNRQGGLDAAAGSLVSVIVASLLAILAAVLMVDVVAAIT
jgi:hypothetical protein